MVANPECGLSFLLLPQYWTSKTLKSTRVEGHLKELLALNIHSCFPLVNASVDFSSRPSYIANINWTLRFNALIHQLKGIYNTFLESSTLLSCVVIGIGENENEF